MKVIKQGKWKERVNCRGCAAVLEFEVGDIKCKEEMLEDESFGYIFFVKCPVCSRQINRNNLPELIREEVLEGQIH